METIMITVKTDNDNSNDRKSKNENDTCDDAFQKGGWQVWVGYKNDIQCNKTNHNNGKK